MRSLLLFTSTVLLLASPLAAQRGRGLGRLGGFRRPLGCPPGSKQVRLPGQNTLHCVMEQESSADQSASAPVSAFAPAAAEAVSAPVLEPSSRPGAPAAPRLAGYERIMRPGLEADLPRGWHLTDAWNDEVPTLYLEADTGREGKPVTMVVSKIARGQEGYLDMKSAIVREKQLQNAKDGGRFKVGGLSARATTVAQESLTVYVNAGGGSYYTLVYSAPSSLYDGYQPAFKRLLSSFQVSPENGR